MGIIIEQIENLVATELFSQLLDQEEKDRSVSIMGDNDDSHTIPVIDGEEATTCNLKPQLVEWLYI